MIRLNDYEFAEIVDYMRGTYGLNLEKKKVLIECRMSRVLERHGIASFGGYLEAMKKDKTGLLAVEMVNCLTTNYTFFMREPDHFIQLKDKILPELLGKRASGLFSVWCAGCSTGEESYTLAMALQEYKEMSGKAFEARIAATDISKDVLKTAEAAVYPIKELERLPVSWRQKYCHIRDDKTFQIIDKLRCSVQFIRQNLMESNEFGKYDVVFCRNVMIYFDRPARERLLHKLEDSLKQGGYLFTGHAELLSRDETKLEYQSPAIYKKI